ISNLIITVLSITIIVGTITAAAHALPTRNANSEKLSPYECGFDPSNAARIPFSFRFFLVAILFLLFDLEIALILPLPPGVFFSNPNTATTLTIVFILILTAGLIYEWINGGLNWAE
uniref:NADH dehdrogenase subunit 3 n=1 Tax=Henricia sanguinolenta TaxID=72675 RepID=UPI0030E26A21